MLINNVKPKIWLIQWQCRVLLELVALNMNRMYRKRRTGKTSDNPPMLNCRDSQLVLQQNYRATIRLLP